MYTEESFLFMDLNKMLRTIDFNNMEGLFFYYILLQHALYL